MSRRRACDSCHAKKIHCDGQTPRCDWCDHRDIPCTYRRLKGTRSQHRSTVGSQDYPGSMQSELQPVSPLLNDYLGTKEAKQLSPLDDSTASGLHNLGGINYGNLHFAGYDLGDISSCHGIPIFSDSARRWIEEKTGDCHAFTQTYDTLWQGRASLTSPIKSAKINHDMSSPLPPQETVDHCFAIFYHSPLQWVFPIVNCDTFPQTTKRAYAIDTGGPQLADQSARVFVLSFVAALSLLEPELTATISLDAEFSATIAERSLLSISAHPTIEVLQSALMLCLYQDFSGQIQAACALHALACRCMFALGGHLNSKAIATRDTVPAQLSNPSHLRELFWLCYFFDKHLSLRTGQPPSLDDSHCDLTLPEDYPGMRFVHQTPHESLPPEILAPFFPSDLGLTVIKSRVLNMLYSASALQKPDTQLLHDIRVLDDELERWRVSVPPIARPCLSVVSATEDGTMPQAMKMLMAFVHFEYFYLLVMIHRPCGRCKAWDRANDGGVRAVSSSLSLSVQASRSTLLLLQAVVPAIHHKSFWLLVFYPMWATLVLFCNILHDPEAEHARRDVQLLKLIPNLLQSMREKDLTAIETSHFSMLGSFVAELVRLANRALGR